MAQILSITDLNIKVNGEPRILDLRLAEALDMTDTHAIRRIINKYHKELKSIGSLVSDYNRKGEGRPSKQNWLTKKQALFICTKSRTKRATDVTIQMVEVFDAYMKGELANLPARHDYRANENKNANEQGMLAYERQNDQLRHLLKTQYGVTGVWDGKQYHFHNLPALKEDGKQTRIALPRPAINARKILDKTQSMQSAIGHLKVSMQQLPVPKASLDIYSMIIELTEGYRNEIEREVISHI